MDFLRQSIPYDGFWPENPSLMVDFPIGRFRYLLWRSEAPCNSTLPGRFLSKNEYRMSYVARFLRCRKMEGGRRSLHLTLWPCVTTFDPQICGPHALNKSRCCFRCKTSKSTRRIEYSRIGCAKPKTASELRMERGHDWNQCMSRFVVNLPVISRSRLPVRSMEMSSILLEDKGG